MKFGLKSVLSLSFLGLSLILTACGQANSTAATDKNGTETKPLKVTATQAIASTDPTIAADIGSQAAIAQVYEGLYTTDKKGQVIPGVATKIVTPTENGKIYTFTLRSNAKWADGSHVTAHDFVYAIRRQADPKTKSQEVGHIEEIKNAKEVNEGKKPLSALGVKALNKHKLQITLQKKTPWFNYRLATEIYPLKQEIVKKYGDKYGTSSDKMLSNGPYILQKWSGSNDSWTYRKNNKYYAAKSVRLRTINVQTVKDANTAENLFASNAVQVTTITGNKVQSNAKGALAKNLKITKSNHLTFIVWNSRRKNTENTSLRKAISYAIDRKSLVRNILRDESLPAKAAVTEGNFSNPKTGKDFTDDTGDLYPHDIAKAKKYWKQAQRELGQKNITLELLTTDVDTSRTVGEYIQSTVEENLKGLKVSLKSVPLNNEVATFTKGDFDFGVLGWTSDFKDPIDFLNKAAITNSINFGRFNDAEYEKLIKDIENTDQSETARYSTMQKAARVLAAKQGITPLYQNTQANLISSKVGGVQPSMLRDVLYRYVYWK